MLICIVDVGYGWTIWEISNGDYHDDCVHGCVDDCVVVYVDDVLLMLSIWFWSWWAASCIVIIYPFSWLLDNVQAYPIVYDGLDVNVDQFWSFPLPITYPIDAQYPNYYYDIPFY